MNALGHDSIVNHYQFVFFNNSFCAKQEIDSRRMKKKAMHFLQQREIKIGGGGANPR